jgi:hypothetical protein
MDIFGGKVKFRQAEWDFSWARLCAPYGPKAINNTTTTNPARNEHLNHEISVASIIAFPSQYNQNNPHTIATICGATTVLIVEVRG